MRLTRPAPAVLLFLAVLAASGAGLTRARAQGSSVTLRKGDDIGAVSVDLDASHVLYGQAMRVFIATGSLSPNCILTLREANDPFNVRPPFCAPRTFNGQDGVLVSVFFFRDVGSDVVIGLTLYQQGARYFGTPVLYPGF